jgi:ABC-type sugar transport system ATPase subunit
VRREFPGTVALDGVDLQVRRGETHALVGENGAGKSTLMSIIAGLDAGYTGQVLLDGEEVRLDSPRRATELGIALIQQEPSLVPDMTVAENIFLGHEPQTRHGLVDRKRMERDSAALLERLGLRLSPSTTVASLTLARRQLVEITKGMARKPSLLILDEPTSSLSQKEVDELFAVVRSLSAAGTTVIYISHRLAEVFALADTITVLRDGSCVATRPAGRWTEPDVVRAMVGRDLSRLYPRTDRTRGAAVLEVRNLGRDGAFEDVSFTLHAGEILGLSGLVGAGRTELAQALFGLEPADRGEVRVDGRAIHVRNPADAIRSGIALVPEDRRTRGFVGLMSVQHNVSLPSLASLSRWQWIRRQRERDEVQRIGAAMGIRRGIDNHAASTLSGGNQQKVVLAKWLLNPPRVLIVDEPTRGIDVGAKAEIHALIDRLAGQGLGVLLISSELPEVMGMSDRILVMRGGRLVAEFPYAEADPAREVELMAAATGSGAALPAGAG